MVTIIIWRDPRHVSDEKTVEIRDGLINATARAFSLERESITAIVLEFGPLDIRPNKMEVLMLTGPGKDGWRLARDTHRRLLLEIHQELDLKSLVPADWMNREDSNTWLFIGAGGAAMPFGRPDLIH